MPMAFDWSLIDRSLFQLVNGWSGHWRLLDSLAAHTLANDLLKASLIGACLMVAWCRRGTPEEIQRTRKILLATLCAAVMVLGMTEFLSHVIVLPRPYLRDAHVLVMKDRQLVPCQPVGCRTGMDGRSREREAALATGTFPAGDWGSFPSDHAGFFVVLAMGLIAAWPTLGWLAMAWTVAILGIKLLLGYHTPLDILGGALIAAVVWIALRGLLETRVGWCFEYGAAWCERHYAWATGIFFLASFEIASTLSHVDDVLHAARKMI